MTRDGRIGRLLSGAPLVALAYGLWAGSAVLLNVILGRTLGAAALGSYAIANGWVRLFYAATDLGVAPHLMRATSRERERTDYLVALFVTLRVAFILVCVGLVLALGGLLGFELQIVLLVVAVAQGVLSLHVLAEGIVQSHQRPDAAATLQVMASVFVFAGAGIWWVLGSNLVGFTLANMFALLAGLAAWFGWTTVRLNVRPRWKFDIGQFATHLARSWPIGFSFLAHQGAQRIPLLVLGAFGTAGEVGALAATELVTTAAGILQSAVTNTVFPKLARSFNADPREFRKLLWTSNIALAAIGGATAIIASGVGTTILTFVFPSRDFGRIGDILWIVSLSVPMLLFINHNIFVFAAADRERVNLIFMVVWVLVGLAIQLLLVPRYGLIGAAWGLVVGRAVGAGLLTATIAVTRIYQGQLRKTAST